MVQRVLAEIKKEYSELQCYAVLAYIPSEKKKSSHDIKLPTLLPEGIESVCPKYAIVWRNKWMIKKSDYVIVYTKENAIGNTTVFAELASRQGKTVLYL